MKRLNFVETRDTKDHRAWEDRTFVYEELDSTERWGSILAFDFLVRRPSSSSSSVSTWLLWHHVTRRQHCAYVPFERVAARKRLWRVPSDVWIYVKRIPSLPRQVWEMSLRMKKWNWRNVFLRLRSSGSKSSDRRTRVVVWCLWCAWSRRLMCWRLMFWRLMVWRLMFWCLMFWRFSFVK